MTDNTDNTDDFEAEFNAVASEKDEASGVKNTPVATEDDEDEVIVEEEVVTPDPAEEIKAAVTEDPFAGWSEAAKAKYVELEKKTKGLEHRINSDDGRVNAYQRKINSLEGEINTLHTKGSGVQPTNQQIKDALSDDENWKSFTETYPEVASAIDKRMDARLEQSQGKMNKAIAPLLENSKVEAQGRAYSEVSAVFPEWQKAVQDKIFNDWLITQPAVVKSLADSNAVDDATALIEYYDNYRVANAMPTLRKSGHTERAADTTVQGGESLEDRRKRQLNAGVSIKSKSAQVDPGAEAEGEFDAAFNAFAKRKERRA